jgi:hypothetical protein
MGTILAPLIESLKSFWSCRLVLLLRVGATIRAGHEPSFIRGRKSIDQLNQSFNSFSMGRRKQQKQKVRPRLAPEEASVKSLTRS